MRVRFLLWSLLLAALSLAAPSSFAASPNYKHFDVAIYCRVYEVKMMSDPAYLERTWAAISKHLEVDKIYLETHRDTIVVDQATLDQAKRFFDQQGAEGRRAVSPTPSTSPTSSKPTATRIPSTGRRCRRSPSSRRRTSTR